MKRLLSFLSYLLTPLFYLVFGLVLLVFQPVQWIAWNLGGYGAHERVVHYLNGALVATYALLGTRVIFINRHYLPQNKTILFIANHQSMLDIPALHWFLKEHHPKFISKKELAGVWPSIGYNLRKSGAALIDRSNTEQALGEIERLGRLMNQKHYSAILFPEGTRSRNGVLKPFAFKGFAKILATNPDALVVPVCIENSWRIFRKGRFPLSAGETMRFTVLDTLEPGTRSISELIHIAEEEIRQQLGQEKVVG